MANFPIHRVDRSRAESPEVLGSKPKFWYREDGRWLLFKAEDRGTGEDWAEVIACHLCSLLGLPHVEYELAAEYVGGIFSRPGVVCGRMAPRADSLVLGNQLLLDRDSTYPDQKRYHVCQHTVEAVAEVIGHLGPPPFKWCQQLPGGITTASEVFLGYLLLDAWIANTDRHHENWAALQEDCLRLAPTFDHAAALARNLLDERRKECLATTNPHRTVEAFASKARSALFESETDTHALGTLEAFVSYGRELADAQGIWLQRLSEISSSDMRGIIDNIPFERMTPVTKDFTHRLLLVNQNRLLSI
jgi:hypothetical protein